MCLSSFVGIGSSRPVDLGEEIREVSSGRSMGEKDAMSAPGCRGVTEVVRVHQVTEVIVHPERATGSQWGRRLILFLLLFKCGS